LTINFVLGISIVIISMHQVTSFTRLHSFNSVEVFLLKFILFAIIISVSF
jgi:hypothetical protein